jgi:hypothetical protein
MRPIPIFKKQVKPLNLKSFLLVVFLCFTFNSFSQIEKGSIVLGTDIGGYKIATVSGVYSNTTAKEEKQFTFGLSADYFLSNAFSLGLGFSYLNDKEDGRNIILVNMNQEVSYYTSVTKGFVSSLRLGYSKKLFNNFYFKGLFAINYGLAKRETETQYFGCECIIPGLVAPANCVNIPEIKYLEQNTETDYISALFQPEFHYYFNKTIGISIGIGGIEYGIVDWNTEYDYWVINFKPNNWTLGLNISL